MRKDAKNTKSSTSGWSPKIRKKKKTKILKFNVPTVPIFVNFSVFFHLTNQAVWQFVFCVISFVFPDTGTFVLCSRPAGSRDPSHSCQYRVPPQMLTGQKNYLYELFCCFFKINHLDQGWRKKIRKMPSNWNCDPNGLLENRFRAFGPK